MHSFSVSKSPSATSTSTITSKNTTTSQDSQPGTADGQRPRISFMGLSTTVNTPESALIPATYHQQVELGLLSEIGTSQIAPPRKHLLHTRPSLSTMTIWDDLPALYHFLMSQHDHKGQHSRSMMLPPS